MLFYYETLASLPRGVVPLTGAVVAPVDRIYRSGDRIETAVSGDGAISRRHRAEDCGPCWKMTSSAGRVLLFRAPTPDARAEWIAFINQLVNAALAPPPPNLERRRSSRATTPTAESPLASPLWFAGGGTAAAAPSNASVASESELSIMVQDALLLVSQQKQEILELKAQVARQQVRHLHKEKAEVAVVGEDEAAVEATPIVEAPVPPPPPLSASSSTSSSSAPVQSERLSLDEESEAVDGAPTAQSFTAASPVIHGLDAATNKSLQEQAAALAEMARSLNRDDHDKATVLTRSRSDGKEDREAAMASSPLSLGGSSNDFLQQQAIELAEIAKSLQSSFRLDRQVRGDLAEQFL
jgi:hypothetical protein